MAPSEDLGQKINRGLPPNPPGPPQPAPSPIRPPDVARPRQGIAVRMPQAPVLEPLASPPAPGPGVHVPPPGPEPGPLPKPTRRIGSPTIRREPGAPVTDTPTPRHRPIIQREPIRPGEPIQLDGFPIVHFPPPPPQPPPPPPPAPQPPPPPAPPPAPQPPPGSPPPSPGTDPPPSGGPGTIIVPGRDQGLSRDTGRLGTLGVSHDRITPDAESSYYIARYAPTSIQEVQIGLPKIFQLYGDHIYIAEVNSSVPVYLQLGSSANPWIRIRQHATYRRAFSQFSIRATEGNIGSNILTCDVLLYVSTGPLIIDDRMDDGLGAGHVSNDTAQDAAMVAGIVGQEPWFRQVDGLNISHPVTVGKNGGILTLKNTDLSNTLYFGFQGLTGYPLGPGESISFKLSGRIQSDNLSTGAITRRFQVWTLIGTCAYAYLVSPLDTDTMDINSSLGGRIIP